MVLRTARLTISYSNQQSCLAGIRALGDRGTLEGEGMSLERQGRDGWHHKIAKLKELSKRRALSKDYRLTHADLPSRRGQVGNK